MRTTPGRVFKNKEVPGHMGCDQVTIQNLKVVDVDVEANVIALKGSVPGSRNGFVIVKPSVKAKEPKK
jgi:large subunit ribosomal protein L3